MSATHLQAQEDLDIKAVYLTAEDLKVAASILYQAYHDDPLFMTIFQVEKEGYESRLRSAIREELNAFWLAKQTMIGLFEGDRLLACACVILPNSAFGPDRFWHWRLKMLLTAGMFSTNQMIEKEHKVRASIPAENYHMLSFIGVHPAHQHKGLGHLLIGAIDGLLSEDNNSEGIGVYVTVPKHQSFFEDGNYAPVGKVSVGQVAGQIMFRSRS